MSLNNNCNVALLVHSCDRYELLYKGFEFFFSKHWDFNANCNCYFATEETDAIINGFINVKSSKGAWANRLALLLKEKITEKYVVYMQEDMWLTKDTNAVFFNKLFELAEKNDLKQIKLHSSSIYKTVTTGKFIEGFQLTKLDNGKSEFLMSHQITLWNKEFLLQQLRNNEHPWRNERKASKRLQKMNAEIYQLDYFAENGNKPINQNNNPVLRSEYFTVSINGVLNNHIHYFITELMKAGNNYRDYALQLEHNFNNNITHDGKPKPRKVDIFKRTKNWLLRKNS